MKSELNLIKGRSSIGNIATRHPIHKIQLKAKGSSTLGGMKIWWDAAVRRLNDDGKGTYLGEFNEKDRLEIRFGGKHKQCAPEILSVEDFIAVKSYKARGKRLSSHEISSVKELESLPPKVNPDPNMTGPPTVDEPTTAVDQEAVKGYG